MKTKLSFLALPLCLGLVLAFALAACGGDSGNSPGASSSSGGAVFSPSSEVVSDNVYFDDTFGTYDGTTYGTVDIVGRIHGSVKSPVVRLEFSPPGVVYYEGTLATGPITVSAPSIVLTGHAYIDLESPSLQTCGTVDFGVKACINESCSGEGAVATKNGQFQRPQTFCNSSSSGEVSSSSEVVWKFSAPNPVNFAQNANIQIGSAGYVKLSGDDGQPDITVTNGKIREAGVGNYIGDEEYPTPGIGYPTTSFFGSAVPTASEAVAQNRLYFLIYFSNNEKYLIRFEAKQGSNWFDWPKQGTYWQATESP
jgi:hypothetical protein